MIAPSSVSSNRNRGAPRKLRSIELASSSRRESSWASPVALPGEEVQLPLHFHTFSTTRPRARVFDLGDREGLPKTLGVTPEGSAYSYAAEEFMQ
jgi:hypothetical protein